ncbi:MAG TPA: serine/threonine-protein kinase [Thermoanaerobaculia bacterium]|nr:serine/threonine-protein kinase [Thermoanaerobaculia bacterium]
MRPDEPNAEEPNRLRAGDRLLQIAEAISDRETVDWEQQAAATPAEASTLQRLRQIANLASVLTGGPAPVADRVLFRWGPLEVLEPIGEGAFGEVFRARDPMLGREVALKLRRRGPADAEFSNRRFLDEARRLARIDHPNVVRVFGADVHDARVGLWTELLESADLGDQLERQGTLSPTEAITAGIEMCRALAAVHAAGIVHGDLKAENVVRARDGRLVLTDFGAGAETATPERTLRARSGTPLAMAPELLEGAAPSAVTDLYALGVLLYRLLTGRHPVEAADLRELRQRHRSEGPTPLLDVRPDLPPALVEVVERALASEPAGRFASAGEMERRLRGVLGGESERRGRVSGAPGAARLWVAAALVGTLALAALAGWSWLHPAAPGSGSAVDGAGRLAAEDTATPLDPPTATLPGALAADPTAAPDVVVAGELAGPASPGPLSLALRRAGAAGVETLVDGARIQPGDQLFLEVAPERTAYLYVLNQDLFGDLFVLFPLADVAPANPLEPGRSYRLPGSRDGVPLDWRVTSAGGTESFLFVASEQRLPELEDELASIESASLGNLPAPAAESGLVLRGVGGLASARGATATADHLERLARWLETQRAAGAAVWLQRIDLANP